MEKLEAKIDYYKKNISNGNKGLRPKLRSWEQKRATKIKNHKLSIFQLCELLNDSEQNKKDLVFTTSSWEKYRNGTRGKSQYGGDFIQDIEPIVPGSVESYYGGPCKLFYVLESDTFKQAVTEITSEFLELTSITKKEWEHSREFVQARSRMKKYLAAPELVRRYDSIMGAFEDCMELVFPDSISHKDLRIGLENIYSGNWDVKQLKKNGSEKVIQYLKRKLLSDELLPANYMTTSQAVCLLIGCCYIRSKFKGLPNSLATLLINEKYFQVLEKEYGLKAKFWFKKPKNNSVIGDEFKAAEKYKDEILPCLLDSLKN